MFCFLTAWNFIFIIYFFVVHNWQFFLFSFHCFSFIYWFVCLFVCIAVYLFIHSIIYLFIYLFNYLPEVLRAIIYGYVQIRYLLPTIIFVKCNVHDSIFDKFASLQFLKSKCCLVVIIIIIPKY